jgi:CheY-like chemotaxis protein
VEHDVSGPPSDVSILVVDDDPDVREILVESLQTFGYVVEAAAAAEQALALVAEHARIGMLISDVRMPGMSGIELVERARALRSDLKAILISGYFLPQPINQRFLKKPFHMRELAAAVADELGMTAQAQPTAH